MVSKGTPKDCYMDDQSNTSFYSFWQSTFLGEYSQQSSTFKTFHQQFFFIKRKNRQDSQAGTFVRCLAIFLQLYELIYVRGYVLYYRWFLLPFVCLLLSYIRNTLRYAEGVLTKLHRSKANFLVQKSWEIELCFGMFCKSSFETPMHVSTKLFPWYFFAVGTAFFYYTFLRALSPKQLVCMTWSNLLVQLQSYCIQHVSSWIHDIKKAASISITYAKWRQTSGNMLSM